MTPNAPSQHGEEFHQAFISRERQDRIRSGKVACALVMFLMPAGVILDLWVYPERVREFFQLRLICSVVAAAWWSLHQTSFGLQHYRLLGVPIAILPGFFIAWMISVTEGPASPYYAGLILVLLAVNAIVHWSTFESLLALGVLYVFYLVACARWPIAEEQGIFFNNIYFLVLAGIIVVIGNYLYNQLQFREFVLRFELSQNRRTLEEANQKLIELDRVKSQFFANVSHELRTPLTLLLTPLQSLIQEYKSELGSPTRDLLLIMQSNGMRLLKLINDLLDLVRLEFGKMEVNSEPVDIDRLVHGVANAVKNTAQDREIEISVMTDHSVGTMVGDSDKLERILLNLLFNAIKFTPAGGRIEITATRAERELLLVISDTGTGISQEQLPFIFDRFWQADTSAQRKNQGLGIGLALVRELVEIQGGEVSASSELGKGTRFTIRLPYSEIDHDSTYGQKRTDPPENNESVRNSSDWNSHAKKLGEIDRQAELYPSIALLRASLRPVGNDTDSKKPRVLIADDEPDMLRYLKSQLSLNFHVIEAVDGRQAIDKASQFLPDVIVCDMMMPEKSGLEVCREIRERTYTKSTPILMLTARADEETKLTALAAGANDFITKPFSTTELRVRLKNLVETFHLQQKLMRQNQLLEATIEQLKDTEVQLVHSEKLASLGRMSAGIIHEINNPLNYAKTGLYVLRNTIESLSSDEKEPSLEVLQDIQDGIDRIDRIVSDLRIFTHPNVTQIERIQIAELVTSALRLVSHELHDKVTVENDISIDQTIWANRNQVTQVLVNLLQNAVYAVEKKASGEKPPRIWLRALEDYEHTLVIIRDNGEGISPENLTKIFDPFFTSKDVGEGMGLGLSICYRIMQQHGGSIEVQSERGVYSQFTLRFPRAANGMAAA
ncbi:MAG TPA: ATP-binding protein [Candidatus Binatia bacterium]